jgi:hypothetical protein
MASKQGNHLLGQFDFIGKYAPYHGVIIKSAL